MEEAQDRPPAMILIDSYFAVYRNRRRTLISGEAPDAGERVPQGGLRTLHLSRSPPPHAGLTFQFVRKRLFGSYLAFTLASPS